MGKKKDTPQRPPGPGWDRVRWDRIKGFGVTTIRTGGLTRIENRTEKD